MKESASTHSETGIAIVGVAGRFPGARTVKYFWRNLTEGVEAIHFASAEELTAAAIDPGLMANPDYVPAAGIVHEQFRRQGHNPGWPSTQDRLQRRSTPPRRRNGWLPHPRSDFARNTLPCARRGTVPPHRRLRFPSRYVLTPILSYPDL